MIKYLFLDMDGVIAPGKTGCKIDNHCQALLGEILQETDCVLVISSSWRKHTLNDTLDYFNSKGFKFSNKIIGITIRAYHYIDKKEKIHLSIPRGVEIKQWIDTHIHSNNGKNFNKKIVGKDFTYCIVDDDTDMLLEHRNNFIKIDGQNGLTNKDSQKIINILNNNVI